MDSSLVQGKTILVTGGARGIGAQICRAYAAAGASIALHYHHSQERAVALQREIQNRGGRCVLLQGDLYYSETCEELIVQAHRELGILDVLINNASVFSAEALETCGTEEVFRHCRINALSPFFLSRAFAGQARQTEGAGGCIVNMLDTRIHDHDPRHYPYHLSKRMAYTMTRDMARQFAPHVRVNAIAPGLVTTPDSESREYYARLAARRPLRRCATPGDILAALSYLIAAPCVTGQVIYVDSGAHLQHPADA